jgi:hypothetical protein
MTTVNREWWESVWTAGAAGQYPDWADLEWYALDEFGAVGMFCSAGRGPIPRAVFRHLDTHLALMEYLHNLPVRGQRDQQFESPSMIDFAQAADRGIFAFDYEDYMVAGYRLMRNPADPLPLDTLPRWARDWLEVLRIHDAAFAKSTTLVVDLSGVPSGLLR